MPNSEYESSSNLSQMSVDFRVKNLIKNTGVGRYQSSCEYNSSNPDTCNVDGDQLGREPKDGDFNGAGNSIDIINRYNDMVKNSDMYVPSAPYGNGNC